MQQRRGGAGIPALQVLRNADFRTLWFFGASAEVARRWELLTLSWFVLQETDSALQLGLPWVFHNLPRPLFGAFFGALADRYGRRSLLMLAQTINALTAVTILRNHFGAFCVRRNAAVARFCGCFPFGDKPYPGRSLQTYRYFRYRRPQTACQRCVAGDYG